MPFEELRNRLGILGYEDTEEVIRLIKDDERIRCLESKYVYDSGRYEPFSIQKLAEWIIWRKLNKNPNQAINELERYLSSDSIELTIAVVVTGIIVSKPVIIEPGLAIVPYEDLPMSIDRMVRLNSSELTIFKTPDSAMILTLPVIKCLDTPDEAESTKVFKELYPCIALLEYLSYALITIKGSYSLVHTSLLLVQNSTPYGLFSNGIGGQMPYNVFSSNMDKPVTIDPGGKEVEFLHDLIDKFSDTISYRVCLHALRRFERAKHDLEMTGAVLDLVIALEMILLHGNNRTSKGKRFKDSGMGVLRKMGWEVDLIGDDLRDLYDWRSEIVHQGMLDEQTEEKANISKETFFRYAESIIQFALLNGLP